MSSSVRDAMACGILGCCIGSVKPAGSARVIAARPKSRRVRAPCESVVSMETFSRETLDGGARPWYVTGFVEGEGTFTYSRNGKPAVALLRHQAGEADEPILEAIRDFFGGIGSIYYVQPRGSEAGEGLRLLPRVSPRAAAGHRRALRHLLRCAAASWPPTASGARWSSSSSASGSPRATSWPSSRPELSAARLAPRFPRRGGRARRGAGPAGRQGPQARGGGLFGVRRGA